MTQCTACAFVFSGRPDPTWHVDDHHEQLLLVIWDQLKETVTQTYPKSRLGYRGVSMVCKDKDYIAFDGYVRKKTKDAVEWRVDDERSFELLLLSTAPQGLLPVDIADT